MADLSITASIQDLNTTQSFAYAAAAQFSQSGANKRRINDAELLVNTSDTTIPLISAGTLGYALFKNDDPTNPIDIKIAAAGTIIARLDPGGGVALVKFGSGITAPVAIATGAACRMRYSIWEA